MSRMGEASHPGWAERLRGVRRQRKARQSRRLREKELWFDKVFSLMD
jgi:hypothetical protein